MIPSLKNVAILAILIILTACKVSPVATPLASSVQFGKIGDKMLVGGIEWLFTKATVTQELKPLTTTSGQRKTLKHFVAVEFTIKNTNNKTLTFATLEIISLTAKDKRYFPLADVFAYIPRNRHCGQIDLSPGMSQDCTLIFEVDTTAQLTAYVGDLQMKYGHEALITLTE